MKGRKPLPLDLACALCNIICDFLVSCGGNYHRVTATLQEKVLLCLASRQFVIKIKDNDIKYFCCWFRVDEEGMDCLKERILPTNVFEGDRVYICELGLSKGQSIKEVINRLYKQNPDAKEAFWHRPRKQDRVFQFKLRSGK